MVRSVTDEPNPYRPLPADFAGPICVQCRHSRPRWQTDPGPHDYECVVDPPELIHPAERCPVTGKVTDAVFNIVRCHERNGAGDCTRYEAKDAEDRVIDAVAELVPRNGGSLGRTGGEVGNPYRRDAIASRRPDPIADSESEGPTAFAVTVGLVLIVCSILAIALS